MAPVAPASGEAGSLESASAGEPIAASVLAASATTSPLRARRECVCILSSLLWPRDSGPVDTPSGTRATAASDPWVGVGQPVARHDLTSRCADSSACARRLWSTDRKHLCRIVCMAGADLAATHLPAVLSPS